MERVHLPILGLSREIDLAVPEGRAEIGELLPMAREISARAMEISVAREEAEGRSVSCRAGCAACCHRHLVPISVVEARALARAVDALPEPRRAAVRARFADAVRAMERVGILDRGAPGRMTLRSDLRDPKAAWSDLVARWFAAKVPCPLLEDDRCSLYEERPIVCREFLVTSPPERCETLGAARVVPRPIHGSEAVATAVREFTGEPLPMLPLPLSLEWIEARGALLDQSTDGENLFNHLVSAVEELVEQNRAKGDWRSPQRS